MWSRGLSHVPSHVRVSASVGVSIESVKRKVDLSGADGVLGSSGTTAEVLTDSS